MKRISHPIAVVISAFIIKMSTETTISSSVWFEGVNRTNVTISRDTIRLIVVGDIGGKPWKPFTTDAQLKVAKTMEKWAQDMGKLDGIINVGDNIYFTGVNHVNDPKFQSYFERVYTGPGLDVTWYMIAGNHDHFGTVSAQVQYTRYSRKWFFPALYYKSSFTFGNGTTVDVVHIDTVELCGNTADFESGNFIDILTHKQHDPRGPEKPNLAKLQWDWINRTLSSSTADYLFVAGHYPVYSVSSHGPTQCLIDKLVPMLESYKVSAYFCGHEHSLQHFITRVGSHQIHHVLSGAASRADYSQKNKKHKAIPPNSFQFSYPSKRSHSPLSQLGVATNGGFVQMNVTNVHATLKFITGRDKVKYETWIYPRRM